PSDRGARGRRLPSFTFPESIVPRSLLSAGGTIDDKEFTALDEIRYQRHPLASGGDGKLMGRAIDQHPQRVRNVLLIKGRTVGGNKAVLGPPQHKYRRRDLPEALEQGVVCAAELLHVEGSVAAD